jgi:hypothetical protein
LAFFVVRFAFGAGTATTTGGSAASSAAAASSRMWTISARFKASSIRGRQVALSARLPSEFFAEPM